MDIFESFFWYDLETFGLNPFYDRIAQFAGQRTDKDLNPIGDPVVLYCRLSADYLPDPQSCMVTGITPQEVKQKGMPEAKFIETINRLFSERGTVVCGFNSIRFDDEFIRNALYRNFLDPYEREWKNCCSRWDILDLVRAAHDLRPQGISWPPAKENGNPSFKLTELTAANHIDQTGAHDAMVDVNATIAIARLIKQTQPKLFDYYLKLRKKEEVKNILNIQDLPRPLIYVSSSFTNPNGCSSLIMTVSPEVNRDNTIICFDLAQDPAPLFTADENSILSVPGVFKLAVNRSPFIADMTTVKDADYIRLGIDKQKCLNHFDIIARNLPSLIMKLRNSDTNVFEKPEDPDLAIYNDFFGDRDKNLFATIRQTPPEQILNLKFKFDDSRCEKMLWRYVCRNYPEVLDGDNLREWKNFAATRIVCPPPGVKTDMEFVERKILEHMNSPETTQDQKDTLLKLQEYVEALKKYLDFESR